MWGGYSGAPPTGSEEKGSWERRIVGECVYSTHRWFCFVEVVYISRNELDRRHLRIEFLGHWVELLAQKKPCDWLEIKYSSIWKITVTSTK